MSTRWYPVYQRGGPQLRVFLPNFWMKLIRSTEEQPPNVVQFECSMEMTKYDIKNYLEKIYDVKCAVIRTRIRAPKTKRDQVKGYVVKEDDVKYAYVTLPKNESFQFPENLFKKQDEIEELDYERSLKDAKQGFEKFLKDNKHRTNMPGWYSI